MKDSKTAIKTKKILVDGFNLIYKFEHLHQLISASQLSPAMEGLIEILSDYAHHAKKKIKIVFDGKKREGLSLDFEKKNGIGIYYSLDRIADDVIKEIIKDDKRSGEVTVITSDKQVQSFVKRHKSFVMKSEDFELLVQGTLKAANTILRVEEPYKNEDLSLSNEELKFWSNLFKKKKN